MSYPEVNILQLIAGARKATGIVVIIDVCRAFTNACYLVSKGIEELYPVSTVEEAFVLKQEIPDAIIAGEVKGRKVSGFDFGNSPSEVISSPPLEAFRLIQRSSAGTQGLVNAGYADELLAGSFVCANSVVRYIKSRSPKVVSFVCMGEESERECDEDTACAQYMRAKLLDQKIDVNELFKQVRESETGDKYRDPAKSWLPEADLDLCLSVDVFDFVLRCRAKEPKLCLERVDV